MNGAFVNQNRMTATYATVILSIVASTAACVAAFRIGYMPFVVTTSFLGAVFGAILVSFSLRFFFQGPWYAFTLLGIIGGLLGLGLGLYGPSYFVTPPTKFISNFEYNRLYAWHIFFHRLLLAFAILGGGAIGFAVSSLPRAVDEPSDAGCVWARSSLEAGVESNSVK
jgi:hypothetical protein